MGMKIWAITMGVGIAVGAVAIMMAPRSCTLRKMASKAADKVEDVACMVNDKLNQSLDDM